MSRGDLVSDFLAQRRFAVVGATDQPQRWGCKIFRYLRERGHEVIPIHPRLESVDGVRVQRSLDGVDQGYSSRPPVDVVNLVVNPRVGIEIVRQAAALGVRRFWAQPGAESAEIRAFAQAESLDYLEACVLVEGPKFPGPGG